MFFWGGGLISAWRYICIVVTQSAWQIECIAEELERSRKHDTTIMVSYAPLYFGSFVNSVECLPKGTRIVSGSGERSIHLRDTETGDAVFTLKAHSTTSDFYSVAGSRLPGLLLAEGGGTLRCSANG